MFNDLNFVTDAVAVLRWGQGGTGPPKSCPGPPKFLDTVVLLLEELIGSITS